MSELNITCPDWYKSGLQTTILQPPCGESLEYDSALIMLQGRLQPRMAAEYGNFVEAVEPLNWIEVEREAQTLLLRSKDIRLVIILMRCRLRKIGVAAVCEGLEALLFLLAQWPDALHPQLLDEGEFVPQLRANAFAELEASEGFLADFRQQRLPSTTGLQVSVRDVEHACTAPRGEITPSELAMHTTQQAWLTESAIASLRLATTRLQQLKVGLKNTLGEEAPDFDRLFALLNLFGTAPLDRASPLQPDQVTSPAVPTPFVTATEALTESVPPTPQAIPILQRFAPEKIESREDALHRLREVRTWFNDAEPSSPVISLLAFTEKTVGKSFVELLQFLPPELMTKLESGKELS